MRLISAQARNEMNLLLQYINIAEEFHKNEPNGQPIKVLQFKINSVVLSKTFCLVSLIR